MKKSPPSPPATLSDEARSWWRRLTAEFRIEDEAGLFLLETALQAFDRMRQAQKVIEQHGVVVKDKYGQLKPNPATNCERDSRAAMLAAFKQLNLDIEPLRPLGRPPGVMA